jgi:hypothetical protein
VALAAEDLRQLARNVHALPNDVGRLVWVAEWVAENLTDLHNTLPVDRRTGQSAKVGNVTQLLDQLNSTTTLPDLALQTLSLLVSLDDSASHNNSTLLAALGPLPGPSEATYRVPRLTWLPGVHPAPITKSGADEPTKPRASGYRDFESIRSTCGRCALIPSSINIEVGLDDNEPLATGDRTTVRIWNPTTAETTTTLTGHTPTALGVVTVAWSPDGTQLATGDRKHRPHLEHHHRFACWHPCFDNRREPCLHPRRCGRR